MRRHSWAGTTTRARAFHTSCAVSTPDEFSTVCPSQIGLEKPRVRMLLPRKMYPKWHYYQPSCSSDRHVTADTCRDPLRLQPLCP